MEKLQEATYFPTRIYAIKKPEFLDAVRAVSARYLDESRKMMGEGEHMTVMSATYAHEESIKGFAEYVSQTAWNILQSQGYSMEQLATFFIEMWTQEHNAFSDMTYHVHNMGSQISAFYFLDVPENGSQMLIHDPRPTKNMISLLEEDNKKITDATSHVVFTPEAGTLLFTNSWLPHSFTKNMSLNPTRFVHMNLGVTAMPEPQTVVV